MTPGASLPPAGVQRPTPPLTEEDLETVRRLAFVAGGRLAQLGPRLVAEVERSWRTINGVEAALTRAGVAITSPLSDAVDELAAEVELLRGRLALYDAR